MQLIGMKREHSRDGVACMLLDPTAALGNVIGSVHGGVVATMLDVVMASAAVSAVGFSRTVVTLSLTAIYLEPGRGKLVANGEVVSPDSAVGARQFADCAATLVRTGVVP